MGQLVRIKLADTEMWVEAEDKIAESLPARVSATAPGGAALDAAESLNSAIRAYCTSLVQSFRTITDGQRPKKVTATFGLKLSGDSKFYVVNIAGEASVEIEAEWDVT